MCHIIVLSNQQTWKYDVCKYKKICKLAITAETGCHCPNFAFRSLTTAAQFFPAYNPVMAYFQLS